MPLRFPVAPMKATMASLPEGDGWAYEVKWDGYRTLVHLDADDPRTPVRLQSTAGKDVSARWPELHAIAGSVHARSAILDGELVVLDDDGRPSFELVQQSGVQHREQLGVQHREQLGVQHGGDAPREAVLYVFDVLQVDGTDTIDATYEDRRRLLDQLVEAGPNWMVPAHRVGDGAALLDATAEQGLEGVIAKRLGSVYRPGTRSKDWRKIKNRRRVTLSIGGYTEGSGTRTGTFGALLVGRPGQDGALAYAGGVGTGFDRSTLQSLTRALHELRTPLCPFDPAPPPSVGRTATWVDPVLSAEIEIAEFTNDGLVRHASFLRLCPT